MATKKRKISSECSGNRRLFHEEWIETYGVIEHNKKALCCICKESVTARSYNIKRHFESKHQNLCSMNDEERQEIIRREVNQQEQQCNNSKRLTKPKNKNNISAASFQLSFTIAKLGKPLSDGNYIKEAFLKCSDHLFEDFQNKNEILNRINELPVARNTTKERIIAMKLKHWLLKSSNKSFIKNMLDDMSTTREEEKDQEEQDDFTEESLMETPHISKDSQGEGNVENSQSDSSVPFKRSRLSYPRNQIPQKEQLTTETADFDDLVKTIMSKIENSDTLDRFDYLAKNWGEKLRNIDPIQRIYVEKLVTDVFYEAELRSLSRNSRVIVGGGSQLPYPEPQNIFPSLAPRHSPQPFTSSFTPGEFASQYQQSNGSDQPTQAQITDDNFVIVKDEI